MVGAVATMAVAYSFNRSRPRPIHAQLKQSGHCSSSQYQSSVLLSAAVAYKPEDTVCSLHFVDPSSIVSTSAQIMSHVPAVSFSAVFDEETMSSSSAIAFSTSWLDFSNP
ncbi:hypothetical protein TB2_044985 [Malus domestica]